MENNEEYEPETDSDEKIKMMIKDQKDKKDKEKKNKKMVKELCKIIREYNFNASQIKLNKDIIGKFRVGSAINNKTIPITNEIEMKFRCCGQYHFRYIMYLIRILDDCRKYKLLLSMFDIKGSLINNDHIYLYIGLNPDSFYNLSEDDHLMVLNQFKLFIFILFQYDSCNYSIEHVSNEIINKESYSFLNNYIDKLTNVEEAIKNCPKYYIVDYVYQANINNSFDILSREYDNSDIYMALCYSSISSIDDLLNFDEYG